MPEDIYSLEPAEPGPRSPTPQTLSSQPAPVAAHVSLTPPHAIDPRTSISHDQECDGCGYNLRGLPFDGRCPECGLPIAEPPVEAVEESVTGVVAPPEPTTPLGRALAHIPGMDSHMASRPLPPPVCGLCGYSLRGSPPRGRCPECGTPYTNARFSDVTFDRMPASIVRRFRWGAWLGTIGAWGFLAAKLADRFATLTEQALLATQLCCAGAWAMSAWLLTPGMQSPAATSRGLAERSGLRQAARWLQLSWFVVTLAGMWADNGGGVAADAMSTLATLAGVVGLAVFTLLLGRVADWVRDDFAERAFNYAFWGSLTGWGLLMTASVLSALMGGLGVIVAPMMVAVGLLVWVGAVAALPVGLFSLARSMDWCLIHQSQRRQHDSRLEEQVYPSQPGR